MVYRQPSRRRSNAIEAVGDQVAKGLAEMDGQSSEQLVRSRREKFLVMGRSL